MLRLGEFVVARVKDRTRAGLDIEGSPFIGYSEQHKRKRRRLRKSDSKVDLTVTGHMLDSLAVLDGESIGFEPAGRGSRFRDAASGQFTTPKVVIGFTDPMEGYIAGIHTEGRYRRGGPAKPRPFVGVTPLEIQEGMTVLSAALYKTRNTTQVTRVELGF